MSGRSPSTLVLVSCPHRTLLSLETASWALILVIMLPLLLSVLLTSDLTGR